MQGIRLHTAKMADCHDDRTPYKVNDVQLMLHLITVFFLPR